jgi:flagellar biosynthesis/type III secretory pathway chaperone
MNSDQSAACLHPVVRAFLAHLEDEEKLLEKTVEVLDQARTVLLSGNREAMTQSLQRQARLEQAGAETRRQRLERCGELAAYLGRPADALALDALARQLPAPWGQNLQARRTRLRQLAAKIQDLNRGNAVLLTFSIGLLDQVLVAITGGSAGGKRYSPTGAYRELGCGSLVSARG